MRTAPVELTPERPEILNYEQAKARFKLWCNLKDYDPTDLDLFEAYCEGVAAVESVLAQASPAAETALIAKFEAVKLQAQLWKQEARTANATIAEIYQICTGATGEPGNWNGAEPVRKALAAPAAEPVLREALTDAIEQLEGWISWKCPAKHRAEHEANVARLRAILGES